MRTELSISSVSAGESLSGVCSLSPTTWITLSNAPSSPSLLVRNGHPEKLQTFEALSSLPLSRGEGEGQQILSLFTLPAPLAETPFFQMLPADGADSDRADISEAIVDLKAFSREHLAFREQTERQLILDWLATSMLGHAPARKIAEKLHQLRESLRQRAPVVVITPEKHCGMHVDFLFRIDACSFYIRGWVSTENSPLRRLAVLAPEGLSIDLLDSAFWHARPDIDQLYKVPPEAALDSKPGFLSYFELPAPSLLEHGWIIQATDSQGESFEAPIPELVNDLKKAREFLIGDLFHERLPAHELRSKHVLPAITRLQERHHQNLRLNYVHQFGAPVSQPEVSIIIPLYRRVDFLEHQLAQFVHDPEMRKAEIIYLLDSPELGEPMRDYASSLFELYGIPFRLAALRTNAGYAGVNNIGAGLAQGRLLLLLNSDVLPERPGWLGRMAEFFDSKSNLGALGVKLLFEDNTLQHAGLYFRQQPGTGLWENQHYFKGLDRRLPAANVTRKVPSVSAACLMIDRELFLEMGGLRGIYVQGDYEDSDLCLRLHEAGRAIWYLPEVELYHLEGQSYASEDRSRNLALNRWIHSWFWGQQIQNLMAGFLKST